MYSDWDNSDDEACNFDYKTNNVSKLFKMITDNTS